MFMNVTDFYFNQTFLCVIDIAFQDEQHFELHPCEDVSATDSSHQLST